MKKTIAMQTGSLRYMSIAISEQLNALHKYAELTTELYDTWQKEKLWSLERSFQTDDKDNGLQLNQQVNLRSRLQLILLNSTFVSCVALFETLLRDICEIVVDSSKVTLDEIGERSYIKK